MSQLQSERVGIRDHEAGEVKQAYSAGYLRALDTVSKVLFSLGVNVYLPDVLNLGKVAIPQQQISLGLNDNELSQPARSTCKGPEALAGSSNSGFPS